MNDAAPPDNHHDTNHDPRRDSSQRHGSRRGGDSGPAVVPGDMKASLLLPAIKHEDLEMPPDGKLSAAEIAAFETWIRRGAADPREGQTAQQPAAVIDIHDLHATILYLLGMDHEQLTYRHAGRDFRLTDVYGNVVREILA